jgi:hypothetical protein
MDYKTGENNKFRMQIWNHLKCESVSMQSLEFLSYSVSDLTRFFVKYNDCHNVNYVNFENIQKKDLFNLSLKAGAANTMLSVPNYTTGREVNFDSKSGFEYGIEVEFIFSFNKNKWALVIEPTYQSYKSSKTVKFQENGRPVEAASIDYSSFQLPIGVRHNFFLNEDSKIFINYFQAFHFPFKSSIEFEFSGNYEYKDLYNAFQIFGIGYKFLNKYSIEYRYQGGGSYKSNVLVLGYTLF